MQNRLSPLILAEKVKVLLQDASVKFIDARGGPGAKERYEAGHLKDSIFVDLELELSKKALDPALGGRHPLPDPKSFGLLLTRLGITPATHVIVYDDKNGAMAAARFWWMLKAAGHRNVQVVDGGLDAIITAGLPVSTDTTFPMPSSIPYTVDQWHLPTATIAEVEIACTNPAFLVIDVREAYRYRGEREPIDLVAGHIPGAVNVPFSDNLDAEGHFLSAGELSKKYSAVIGGRHPDHVIVHCGSGVTACHTLLAMHQAGLEGAQLYVGSWSEWSRNNRPIATGDR